ncbi:hypothetical protein [Thalassotalea profundi]|uniref:Ribbon-helix-helix protein CopG domain-containing protein n=1 Tax=Thalassotalea profundi TaxID=2036687 RepID=A0ABQ3IK69_9GAMM|nr:hypothetical protein [Thalassotalea profundi]GHE86260.1 hypothetical protein GCM10011501_14200 [Thalassotalea profundi]
MNNSKIENRFTLQLTPELLEFIDSNSKLLGITRSKFVREVLSRIQQQHSNGDIA